MKILESKIFEIILTAFYILLEKTFKMIKYNHRSSVDMILWETFAC